MPVTLRQRTVRKGQYREDYEADLPLPPNPIFIHPDVPFNPNARPAAFPTIPLGQRFVEPPSAPTRVQRLLKEINPDEPDPPTDEKLLDPNWKISHFEEDPGVSWIICRTVDFTYDISDSMKLLIIREILRYMTINQAIQWLQLGDNAVNEFLDLFRREATKARRRDEADAIITQHWRNMMTEGETGKSRIEWLAFREMKLAELEYSNTTIEIDERDIYLGSKFLQMFSYKEDDPVYEGVEFISDNIQADIEEFFGPHGKLRNMSVGSKDGYHGGEVISGDDSTEEDRNEEYLSLQSPNQEPIDNTVLFGSASMANELHRRDRQELEGEPWQDDDENYIHAQEVVNDESYLPYKSEVVGILRNLHNATLRTTLRELDYPDEFIVYFKAWMTQRLVADPS